MQILFLCPVQKIIKMSSKILVLNQPVLHNKISSGKNLNSFEPGSTVFGRVVSKNSDGTFNVSFAGKKISVRSNLPLMPGQTFSARAAVKNGTVYLSLLDGASAENLTKSIDEDFVVKFNSENPAGKLDNQSSVLLQSLGIEPNLQAFRLVQLMKQMGMKIDVDSAKKALRNSENFEADEKEEAAQISFLLDKKGLKSGEKTVKAVLRGFSGEERKRKKKHDEENNLRFEAKNPGFDRISAKFFLENYLESVDFACKSNRIGALTAFNSLKLKNTKGDYKNSHLIILPFEWKSQNCVGDIRVFLDYDLRNLKKIVINCKKNVKNLVFVLYFKAKKVESLKFGFDFSVSSKTKEKYSALLSKIFSEMLKKYGCASEVRAFEVAEFDKIKNFGAGDETIAVVQGFA